MRARSPPRLLTACLPLLYDSATLPSTATSRAAATRARTGRRMPDMSKIVGDWGRYKRAPGSRRACVKARRRAQLATGQKGVGRRREQGPYEESFFFVFFFAACDRNGPARPLLPTWGHKPRRPVPPRHGPPAPGAARPRGGRWSAVGPAAACWRCAKKTMFTPCAPPPPPQTPPPRSARPPCPRPPQTRAPPHTRTDRPTWRPTRPRL